MSAIVQLSFNVSEKLRLDDHAFPTFDSPHHKSEAQSTQSSKPIASSAKESEEQRASQSAGLTSFVPSTLTPSSTSNIMPESGFFGAPRSVLGVACPRYDLQKSTAFPRRDIKPVALVRTSTNIADSSQTTVYDLRECSSQMYSRKTLSTTHSSDKFHGFKTSVNTQSAKIDECDQHNTITETQPSNLFPSIIGKSCVLHPAKKQTCVFSGSVTDVPPIKKHCRSVSEPDDLVDLSPERSLQSPSSWRHVGRSRVWVPTAGRYSSSRRAHSASTYGGKLPRDCSRSLDCGRLLHSGNSITGDSLLTPPDSPVPRPASVTVIKQEGGAWTFLSSQHTAPGHFKQCSFSPLPSPCNISSPYSTRSQDAGYKSSHTGLSATKRSLSFSDDFEHRESIQYTPTSTPELERRRGGLLRCQSHPSDLNLKRSKGRRRSRACHNRPTLDFAKMKQTSINKRNRCRDRSFSGSTNTFSTLPTDVGQVKPVFPSIFGTEIPLKNNTMKLQPVPSLSPPSVSFSIGCTRSMSDIHRRIPSPTDELAFEPDGDTIAEVDGELVTASGGVALPFVRECHDLNVDEIENETDCDDDMKT